MRPRSNCAADSEPLLFPAPAPPQGGAANAVRRFTARQRLGKIGEIKACSEPQQPIPVLVPLHVGVEQADLGENPGLADHGGAGAQVASPYGVGDGENAIFVPGPCDG